jgi:hypothetical protein
MMIGSRIGKFRRMNRTVGGLWWLLCLLTTSGCLDGFGTSAPIIWGRITYKNAPIHDALVIYTPETSDTDALVGVASVNSKGNYELEVTDRGTPLASGWYRITLIPYSNAWSQRKSEGTSDVSDRSESRRERARHSKRDLDLEASSKPQEPQHATNHEPVFPASYQNERTTRLKVWVRPQPMRIDINLTDD